jgi:hypothetical protein
VRATRLTGRDVARIVKARLEEAGFDPQEYSGHSLRSAYVTSAMDAGTDIFAAADQGRWKRLERCVSTTAAIRAGRLTRSSKSKRAREHGAPSHAPDRVR